MPIILTWWSSGWSQIVLLCLMNKHLVGFPPLNGSSTKHGHKIHKTERGHVDHLTIYNCTITSPTFEGGHHSIWLKLSSTKIKAKTGNWSTWYLGLCLWLAPPFNWGTKNTKTKYLFNWGTKNKWKTKIQDQSNHSPDLHFAFIIVL